jgi:hypothetical protein
MKMRDNDPMDRALRQLVAATEAAGGRAEIEAKFGVRLGRGVWVEGLCLDASGNITRRLWFRLLRQLLPSGRLRLTLQGPALARGAFIGRLILEGQGEDGTSRFVAIPIGDMPEQEVEIEVPETAVRTSPIPLAEAFGHSLELRLTPWVESVAARFDETVTEVYRGAASVTPGEMEKVIPLGQDLRAVLTHIATDRVLFSLESDDRSRVGQVVRFALADEWEEDTIAEGYAELERSASQQGASAQLELRPGADLPSDLEVHIAVLEEPTFAAEDLSLLQWSYDHARGRTQQDWARQQMDAVIGPPMQFRTVSQFVPGMDGRLAAQDGRPAVGGGEPIEVRDEEPGLTIRIEPPVDGIFEVAVEADEADAEGTLVHFRLTPTDDEQATLVEGYSVLEGQPKSSKVAASFRLRTQKEATRLRYRLIPPSGVAGLNAELLDFSSANAATEGASRLLAQLADQVRKARSNETGSEPQST